MSAFTRIFYVVRSPALAPREQPYRDVPEPSPHDPRRDPGHDPDPPPFRDPDPPPGNDPPRREPGDPAHPGGQPIRSTS